MTFHALSAWAQAHPWPATLLAATFAVLVAGAAWCVVRAVQSAARPSGSLAVTFVAAAACTAYSADTSWGFAENTLGMTDTTERSALFAVAEIVLLSCALMARANKSSTATEESAGSTGVPGVLVWVITGVQIIPCYAESGFVGGTVRAVIGPVMSGMLWHLALGLEIRVKRPAALSSGLAALIGRELRERLLSRLGLAVRDRSAEQISRDRATSRAVRLAARPKRGRWAQGRLAAAVARAGVGTDPVQRQRLLDELAARRNASDLATIPLKSPWAEPIPSTASGPTRAAVVLPEACSEVRADPGPTPEHPSTLGAGGDLPVGEQRGPAESGAGDPLPTPASSPEMSDPPRAEARPGAESGPSPAMQEGIAPASHAGFLADSAEVVGAPATDLTGTPVHSSVPDTDTRMQETRPTDPPEPAADLPANSPSARSDVPAESQADPDPYLTWARTVDSAHRQRYGRPASIEALKKSLRVGQDTAKRLKEQLKPQTEEGTA
jgi:hypothetical protein